MAAVIQKTIGAPRTISTVQKYRKLLAVTEYLDDNGAYSVGITYREYELDSNGNVVSDINLTKTISDAQLNAAAKSEIDSIYTRALGAI